MKYSLCDDWEFTECWSQEFLRGEGSAASVRLPHTCRELGLHYIDPADYQMVCGYRRNLRLPEGTENQRIFLQFDGAAHIATVYVNGGETVTHRCGYTPFRVEITPYLRFDGADSIAVKLDTTENPAIPPFGYVIDYLTYGGLCREVWLETRNLSYIDDIFVQTPTLTSAKIQVSVADPPEGARLEARILDSAGNSVWSAETSLTGTEAVLTAFVPQTVCWDTEHPQLYTCAIRLLDGAGEELDRAEQCFGFRTAEFKADGFYLNGKKTFLRGLNRHQNFPYMGYAAPESLQREDVRILQEELGCNAVRTSHYPQSPYFMDECDRRGLLVFTEFPGWQHIGDKQWKEQALENLREMILRDRSHPSVVLWGVRINESQDDDEFYRRTNALAHELDPSRATSGVRYLEKSSLLEDVYAYNDFSHNGVTPGAREKKDVTPDLHKALLISECNGHMYPTKPFDVQGKRQEQALRHIRVQNAALESGEHAGCFGWCMFDYPTHPDFGSGDRICYHGVLDVFRNPKLAAAAYASQGEKTPVLEVGSSMDIGDYPAGKLEEIYVFSNAETVELYKNDEFVTALRRSRYTSLPHPPFVVDDTIGKLLETQEGYPRGQADIVRECLLAAGKYGLPNLPLRYKLKLLWCMVRYHMKLSDGVDLYGKYISSWGGEATRWRFDGKVSGKTVASVTCGPAAKLRLEAKISHTVLREKDSYDMAAVRIRVLDENGRTASYAQLPVEFEVSGPAALVGPCIVTAEGGMCGTYLKTTGQAGTGNLTIRAQGLAPVCQTFTVEISNNEVSL